ncbi:hypothetical protein Dsin_018434 [Dipteronia sinensis]|uniref:Reverse transcriptase n=1 Tax=Dipteronia sinensis TaxID=43782 RepID=A0AAE0E1X1_9ROSI|nr:hypothetical protein Dsin_018434 [Dipteronia sinensis]
MSKTLVQRIRPLLANLVSPNQVAFVTGKQIQDIIVVAQEVLHKFKEVKEKLGFMAWKIDLATAYGGPKVSDLFFTDDFILFGHASEHQASITRNCLDSFYDLSGEHVSFSNSRVFCSNNISDAKAKELGDLCGSPITKNLGNYLGVPLIHGRITKNTYNHILEKSQKRLASWKSVTLSFAGRCVLIKAVASALPIYAMQSIKLTSDLCSKLDKISRDFLWSSNSEKKKVHLVNWKVVCLPKNKGGIGIKNMKLMNQPLLAKAG